MFRKWLFNIILCLTVSPLFAQPANDNCANASEIVVGANGYGFGLFTGVLSDMTTATIQTGETFAPSITISGFTRRSAWYKFKIPTTRSIRVSLAQPGSTIQAGNVGFAVYKTSACLPGNAELSTKLSPIETFGNTFHPCVGEGEYYIQVASNNNANGAIYITIEVADPLPALYDKASNPQQFGILKTQRTLRADFDVDCQGIDSLWENCQPQTSFKDFTKSTWHTFTTPAYFDYLGILLSETTGQWNRPDYTVGYRLFEGNSETTPIEDLVQVSGCDSLRTNGYYPGQKAYKCGELKPNTTYTIQLIYHKDFVKTMRLCVTWDGTSPTKGPLPVNTLAAGNKMGALNASPAGLYNYATDTLACNSRHQANCGPGMEPEGFKFTNNYRYNLSAFFSFSLTKSSALEFLVTTGPCEQVQTYIRVYKQSLGDGCNALDTSKIVGEFIFQAGLNCLEPGDYIVQVMGSDSLSARGRFTYSTLTTNNPICMFQHLGRNVSLRIRAYTLVATNNFSMSAPGRVNRINANASGVLQALIPNVTYAGLPDTFGCANTVLPNDPALCTEKDKAVFRTFNVADSGILYHSNVSHYNFKVYKGDINELAIAQNKFSPGQTVDGLIPYSKCSYYTNYIYLRNTCLVPGTYTLANFGSERMLGSANNHRITFLKIKSKFMDPAAPDDLGNVIDSMAKYGRNNIVSKADTFSCRDNPVTIDGKAPCLVGGIPATKLHYRQFYLSVPSRLSITDNGSYGILRMFRGKVSEVGTAGLKAMPAPWDCFHSASTSGNQCDVMEEGWYTVVTCEGGPTYENPLSNYPGNSQSFAIGLGNSITVSVTPACARPKYNRPYKASAASGGLPHNVDWKVQPTHAPAYPVTGTTINLPTENFDCSNDTPFVSHPILNCAPAATGVNQLTKVAYYVWEITKSSYIQITLPSGMWGVVYPLDVRKDSALLTTATPIQPCMDKSGFIQLCKMQPGIYTLAVFGRANMICTAVTPSFYVDSAGYSRFDYAYKAYDFGSLIPDKTFRNGKPGDTNPLHPNRPASNDFFYCTTGAQERDPTNASCLTMYVPEIYKDGNNIALFPDASKSLNTNYIAKRNLWYTFTINDPGTVYIKVENKTPGRQYQYPFAVYRSDVDGSLDFNQVKAAGEVDSTIAQGLTYLANNFTGHYCSANQQISIYNDPCTFKPTRYYILVENRNPYWSAGIHVMNPNSQVEVSLRLDSVQVVKPKFDYYSKASDLGTVGAGKFRGDTDNFTCATRNLPDPVNGTLNACQKSLWYKFTTTVTGNIRYRVSYNATSYNTNNQLQLFRQLIPGDSTSKGLQFLPAVATESSGGFAWMRRCISPGTYYLLLPGCNAVNETVFPEIEILEQEGDFCSTPKITQLSGAGVRVLPVVIDCHTIGTDYGEFNPTLTCPALGDRTKYKTSWYRLDIGGNDTLDVTVFIDEKTNATPSEIKYRMMTGTCSAMQEQSCVQDALTRNTYKCLAPGNSYYIQVITPLVQSSNANVTITGSIDLNIEAIVHQDVCNPANPCIAVANFTPQFDCTKDRNVTFYNYSTYGTGISYEWDFGYNNQTSNEVSPQFFYPALTVDRKYQVRLIVTNISCGKKDTIQQEIDIPARPFVNLGPDVVNCTNGTSVSFDATSHAGSTYRWSTNSTLPTATFNNTSLRWVQVTYNNCIARDSVNIWVNPIAKRALQTSAICNTDEVTLNANRSQGEQYTWNTGAAVNSISTGIPGYYWVDLFLNGCTIRDSFNVVSTAQTPLGSDTTICQAALPYVANATVTGATLYRWQNNAATPSININQSGIYWVDITVGGCKFRDSLVVEVDSVELIQIAASICEGDSYALPGGGFVNTAGIYRDTLYHVSGCDSLITTVALSVDTVKRVETDAFIYSGQTYTLPWGVVVNTAGIYSETLQNASGCDSLITLVNLKILTVQTAIQKGIICTGGTYLLPWGEWANGPGNYADTLRNMNGGDSVINLVQLSLVPPSMLTNDTTVCQGVSFALRTGPALSYKWTPGIGLSDVNSQSPVFTANQTQTYLLETIHQGENLVRNGNFEQGNAEFISEYNYAANNTTEGEYFISNNPVAWNGGLSSCRDHTSGSGMMMMINGSPELNREAWKQTIQVRPNTNYAFSAWLQALYPVNAASLSFSINGVDIGTLLTAALPPCNWRQFYAIWNSGNQTTATISIINKNMQVQGNDFALDDIFFGEMATCTDSVKIEVTGKLAVNESRFICAGETFKLPGGNFVNTPGIYFDTLRNSIGCDSVVYTIDLKVNSLFRNNASTIICSGNSFTLPSGKSVNAAGVYNDTVRYVTGCDSLISVINLTVTEATFSIADESICSGLTYTLPGGRGVSTPGIYSDTLRDVNGCDSLISRITLSVIQVSNATISAFICAGQTYTLPSGRVVSAAGNYRDTLRYAAGCDSLISVITLSVPPVQSFSVSTSVCPGQSYTLPSGRVVSNPGFYRDTLRFSGGCDSVITAVNITSLPVQIIGLNSTICSGQSYSTPSGKILTNPGIYQDTLRYLAGCDSVVYSINLSVARAVNNINSAFICAGQAYTLPGGRVVSTPGVYTDTLRDKNGCDSLISRITLAVNPVFNQTETGTICASQSYRLPSGRVVLAAGIYRDTIRYAVGCDSLITVVTLRVPPVQSFSVSVSVCPGQSYTLPSGLVVRNPGGYRDTLRYTGGCDSVITITTITSLSAQNNSLNPSICGGQIYTSPSGKRLTSPGIYDDTLRYRAGCDSIIFRINLSISPVITSSVSAVICNGASYSLPGGRVVNAAGIYKDTLKTIAGCDSIVTTTINSRPPLVVTLTGPAQVCVGANASLVATASGGTGGPFTYSWTGVTGNGNTATPTVTRTTQYIITVSDGCTAVPARDTVSITAIPLPVVNAGLDTTVRASVPFTLRPGYGNGVVSYLWSPATYLSCTNCPNPIATIEEEMVYTIRVTNVAGCEASDSRTFRLLCNASSIFLPNTFTPNSDGVNDVWYPRGSSTIKVKYLKVFNRWGQVIFERSNFSADDRSAGWDGNFKGTLVAPDVFVYSMGLECSDGKAFETRGNVMVVR